MTAVVIIIAVCGAIAGAVTGIAIACLLLR